MTSEKLITFHLNGETLIFKKVNSEYGGESLAFGLFKQDGTCLGKSLCRTDRFRERVWYLSDIEILPQFKRCGYGSELLEKTCAALWQIEKMDIFLERPGNSIAPDDFDRKTWYERHGFIPHSNPDITFMWRELP
jgi:ribosomal protein S18 acetylase RimI-like enzyme